MSEAVAPAEKELNVLIVEDEPGDAELALWRLREAGFQPSWRRVETESDYLAALQDPPDVILCDHRLPKFGSEQALRLLQGLGLDIPFIIVSGALGEEEAVAAMRTGAADYLLKDRLGRLGAAVERAIEERRVRAELARSQRLESIGTLAAGIAHDFNNLLGIILGHVALAEAADVDSERRARSLEAVRVAAERAAGLVRQILTFARKRRLRFQNVDLNQLVAELSRLVRETFPRKVELRLELAPELPPVRADATMAHQLLLNLCVNARDAMPDGGALTIRTSCAGPQVVVSVVDEGVGMDAATLARIFDPFFTTKAPSSGTGLGLAVVHSTMESHGGSVEVSSAPGRGSTFTLRFPAAAAGVEQAAPAPAGDPGGGQGEKILVVDDEESLLVAVGMMLEDAGYSALAARNAAEALSLFQQHSQDVDLVITDLEMPTLSGRELAARLRCLDPGVRVMFTTGYLEPMEAVEAAAAGVAGVLRKPFTPALLLQQVRAALDAPRQPASRSGG